MFQLPALIALTLVAQPVPTPPGGDPPAPARLAPPSALRVLWSLPIGSHCFGSAAVADADGDGGLDVAFATYFGDSTVRVLRGRDGSPLWSYKDTADNCYDASCRFADVAGDGTLALVVPCSSGSRVHAFDAASGKPVWTCALDRPECIDTPPWIGDADGDGATDVVVGSFRHNLKIIRGKTGELAAGGSFDIGTSGAVQTCPVVMDLNGDGAPDLIGGIFGKKGNASLGLHAVSGKDHTRLWHVPLTEPVYHGPAVGALTPGGAEILTIGCYDGNVYRIDPKDGRVLATIKTGDRYIMSPVTLADVDSDGTLETIATCEHIAVINADNTIRWSKPVAPEGRGPYENVSRGVSVADLNGDGRPDLAFVTSSGLFRVLNAAGDDLYQFDAAGLCGEGKPLGNMSHGPVLADLSGDGRLDAFLVISGGGERQQNGTTSPRYGAAVCLTGFEGTPGAEATNGWYMLRHDERNTGNVGTPLRPALAKNIAATAKHADR